MSFFTRAESKPRVRASSKALPLEYIRRIGPDAVRAMNPEAAWNIKAVGHKRPQLLVLADAPGEQDDLAGRPCQGPGGVRLRRELSAHLRARFGFLCATRPPGGRPPSPAELEAFRGQVEAQILATRPRAVLMHGLGLQRWLGFGGTFSALRGRKVACRVGDHSFWVVPTYGADWAAGLSRGKVDGAPVDQIKKAFARDVETAVDLALYAEPPEVEPLTAESARKLVYLPRGVDEIRQALRRLRESETVLGWDYETNALRPYRGGLIQTCALSDGERTVAFPVHHRDAGFSSKQTDAIHKEMRRTIRHAHGVVAHHLPFELEWYVHSGGQEGAQDAAREGKWHCSLASSYVLDSRQNGLSLDFQSRVHFGVPLKSLSDVDTKRIATTPLDKVLPYNGLDALFTRKLHLRNLEQLREERQSAVYREQVRRVPTAVMMQYLGLHVDQKRVAKLEAHYKGRADKAFAKFEASKAVAAYKRRYGAINIKSDDNLVTLFRDVLGSNEGQPKEGEYRRGKSGTAYTVDASMLRKVEAKHPVAKHILRYKAAYKLLSTYVRPYMVDAKDGYVYPDGCIHCLMKTTATDTRRFASEDPNNQNWPKRKDARVRSQIVAPEGHVILSSDYGQIEARVLAMASKDPRFVEALWNDQDIHMEWAERISDRHNDVLELTNGDLGKFRSEVKNRWVFPLFFGSSVNSVARALALPLEIAERLVKLFWKDYAGIHKWQKELVRYYNRHFFTETLTGFRRQGPLSYNQIINAPIQGTAADITTDAMNRISEFAARERIPHLQPVLQVHDDILFYIPVRLLKESIKIITRMMLTTKFKFINVPLTCNPASGPDLQNLAELGAYTSKDLN